LIAAFRGSILDPSRRRGDTVAPPSSNRAKAANASEFRRLHVAVFIANGKHQFTPEYGWPANRAWCVCSDYDLQLAIVAGSKDLISAVLKNSILKALEVIPQKHIDYLAPMPQ